MSISFRLVTLSALILAACSIATAQIKREVFAYNVKSRPVVSIRNQYGRITVTPSASERVVATVVHSDAVEIQGAQNGNRIELATGSQRSTGVNADNVDYTVLVPRDACVILSTAAGSLSAENLDGDLNFEGATASVDAHALHNAHVQVKTLKWTDLFATGRRGQSRCEDLERRSHFAGCLGSEGGDSFRDWTNQVFWRPRRRQL